MTNQDKKKTYGILAHPAGHSLSPLIHNAAFKALGINAEYKVFDVSQDDLENFMKEVKEDEIAGLSVSLPHKESIIGFLDDVSEDVKTIGACNTVVNNNGKLGGYNFDWIGVLKSLEEHIDLSGKKCLILGAGGAARAAVYGLSKVCAEVIILNRSEVKASQLASDFSGNSHAKITFGPLEDAALYQPDIIIQSTSCWLQSDIKNDPDFRLLPKDYLKPTMLVMDMVYKPLITPLLQEAMDTGATVVTGEKMLLYQAYSQFELWTSQKAPNEIMAAAISSQIS